MDDQWKDGTAVRRVMDSAWRPEGYTSPNREIYPWMWLWDSCFHVIIWHALGDERATVELESIFSIQDSDGFMPHMGYQSDPEAARPLWSRPGSSVITQPPMYGHALRMLDDAGVNLPGDAVDAASRAVRHLLDHRLRGDLAVIVHPWESGCDDSARWGSWMPEPFQKAGWDQVKLRLIETATRGRAGGAIANPAFEVPSVMFNALLAFNLRELASVTGDSAWLEAADQIVDALRIRWRPSAQTWIDGTHASGSVPTLEALLPLLVIDDGVAVDDAWGAVEDPELFAAPFGPRQTALSHDTYDSDAYWRGPTWPQLNYLLWVAATRHGRTALAGRLAEATARGARRSGLAEYWNPESGAGRGAIPQSWTGLAWVMQGEST